MGGGGGEGGLIIRIIQYLGLLTPDDKLYK